MPYYARIWSKLVEDEDVNELVALDPLAEVLRLWCIARADVYGVVPGNLAVFRGKVCPFLAISDRKLKKLTSLLQEKGFLRGYASGGRRYFFVANFHKYQDVKWERVGRPQYPLPPDWEPPAALIQARSKNAEVLDQVLSSVGVSPGPGPGLSPGPGPGPGPTVPRASDSLPDVPDVSDSEGPPPVHQNVPPGDLATAAAAAAPRSKKPPKEKTPEQEEAARDAQLRREAIDGAFAAHGWGKQPKSPPGYGGLMKLAKSHMDRLHQWTQWVQEQKPALEEGADPWETFCTRMREAMNRPWEWDPTRQKRPERWLSPGGQDHSKVGRLSW
jgi:hypothetical protein